VSRALPRTARPLAVTLGGVVPLALVLAGCGAGFDAQTYQERTIADLSNTAVGAMAVRAVSIAHGPGPEGVVRAGDDALVTFTLVNDGAEDDVLLGVESPVASSVEIVERQGEQPLESVVVPRLGTTGDQYAAVLRGVTQDLRPGEWVEITMRFERNGATTVPAPVTTTGEYDEDRPKSENFHLPGEEKEETGENDQLGDASEPTATEG
jgi:periplasmic copper chaperone A